MDGFRNKFPPKFPSAQAEDEKGKKREETSTKGKSKSRLKSPNSRPPSWSKKTRQREIAQIKTMESPLSLSYQPLVSLSKKREALRSVHVVV